MTVVATVLGIVLLGLVVLGVVIFQPGAYRGRHRVPGGKVVRGPLPWSVGGWVPEPNTEERGPAYVGWLDDYGDEPQDDLIRNSR